MFRGKVAGNVIKVISLREYYINMKVIKNLIHFFISFFI